jgi:hypothetical protein
VLLARHASELRASTRVLTRRYGVPRRWPARAQGQRPPHRESGGTDRVLLGRGTQAGVRGASTRAKGKEQGSGWRIGVGRQTRGGECGCECWDHMSCFGITHRCFQYSLRSSIPKRRPEGRRRHDGKRKGVNDPESRHFPTSTSFAATGARPRFGHYPISVNLRFHTYYIVDLEQILGLVLK